MTGAGIVDCKKALQESGGDITKAIEALRKKGLAMAVKKSTRATGQGLVESYIHAGGKLGVLIEVNCETDFVARLPEFQALVKEIAMQIAAANPLWIKKEDVPADVVEKEREIYAHQLKEEKKPDAVIEKIMPGKLDKFYAQVCLLEQPHMREPSGKTKVKDIITAAVSKIGENIVVKKFARFRLGEE
jgi:elongation factor Ts